MTSIEYIFFASVFLIGFIANVWLLRSSLLPLVKIDSDGVTAYSIFWKKYIKWDAIQNVRLIKVSQAFHRNGTKLNLEATRQPETRSVAAFNNGKRIVTFIIVSDQKCHFNSKNTFKLLGVFDHATIAGEHGIAFRYDLKSWDLIQQHLPS